MNEKKNRDAVLEELLWKRWDGELSESEAVRLEEALSQPGMSRASEEAAILDLAATLGSLSSVEAPHDLKPSVMRSVRARMAREVPSVSWSRRLGSVFANLLESVFGPQEGRVLQMGRKQLALVGTFVLLVVGGVTVVTQVDFQATEKLMGAIGGVEKADRYRNAPAVGEVVGTDEASEVGVRELSYDADGYDLEGFNREGFNREGFNRSGFNQGFRSGFNREGFNRSGFNREGFNRSGFNREGFNREGFSREGFNREGFNREGFNRSGFSKEGFNREGFSKLGFNREGFDKQGFDKGGMARGGMDKGSMDRAQ